MQRYRSAGREAGAAAIAGATAIFCFDIGKRSRLKSLPQNVGAGHARDRGLRMTVTVAGMARSYNHRVVALTLGALLAEAASAEPFASISARDRD